MLATVADAAQRHRSDAQVRSDIVLRDTLKHFGMLFQQVVVTLLGTVFDPGDKKVLVRQEAVKDMMFDLCPDGIGLRNDPFIVFFVEHIQQAGFDGFDAKKTGLTSTEALYRRYTLAFEKELGGYIAALVVEANPQATPQYEKSAFSDIAFLQQYRAGRHLQPFEKVNIFMPFMRRENRACIHDREYCNPKIQRLRPCCIPTRGSLTGRSNNHDKQPALFILRSPAFCRTIKC